MTCTFCKSDKPKPHNVRTCARLDAAVAIWTSKKATEWTLDGFKDALVGALINELALPTGLSALATLVWNAYSKISGAIDIGKFLNAPRSQQSAVIKKVVEGDDIDAIGALLN